MTNIITPLVNNNNYIQRYIEILLIVLTLCQCHSMYSTRIIMSPQHVYVAPRDFTVDECGLLVILPTVNSVVCRISIVDDDVLERREEFRVQLITSQLRVVASGNTTLDVVILDNDGMFMVSS